MSAIDTVEGRSEFDRKREYKENKNQNVVWVGNLSFKCSERDLQDEFSTFGKIVSIDVPRDSETRKSKGFGFIEFESAEDADKAVKAKHKQQIDGREITVELSGKASSKPKPSRYEDRDRDYRRRDYGGDRHERRDNYGESRNYNDRGRYEERRPYEDGGYNGRRTDDRREGRRFEDFKERKRMSPYERREPPPRRDADLDK
jgi:cold-inducible RNA-binding protein